MRIINSTLIALALAGSAAASTFVGADAVQSRIADAIAARAPAPGQYKVQLADNTFQMRLSGTSGGKWQIANLNFNPAQQSFHATLGFTNDLGNAEYVSIAGSAYPVIQVPALAHDLLAGEAVAQADLVTVEVPSARAASTLITSADTVVGQIARRNLRANAPLFVFDLAKPVLIKKGDIVTITYLLPGIQLSAQGVATGNAGKGDMITLMNTTSRRMIEARVTGAGAAVIGAPTATIAASN